MKLFNRIIDKQGAYYQIDDIPSGDQFCRVMGIIGKGPDVKMHDVRPVVYYKTANNGFLGTINKFKYDEVNERYLLYFDNCEGYDPGITYHLYISMRIFEVDTIVNDDGVYYLDILDDEFYQLMRDAENNNVFSHLSNGYKVLNASVWASGENSMPEIEYFCNWDSRNDREIPRKEFYRLSDLRGKHRKRTDWLGLKHTTGLKTLARNGKYTIKSNLGMAMIEDSGNSKYCPNCLEMTLNDGINNYIVRLYFDFLGLTLSGLTRYRTNAMQTWISVDGLYYTNVPNKYESGVSTKYYDGDDFNSSAPDEFRTPEKIYIYRAVSEISEYIYFDSGLNNINIKRSILRDFQSTDNHQDNKAQGSSVADKVDVVVSGSDFTVTDDGTSTTLSNAIANNVFSVGDLFVNDNDGYYASIKSIDGADVITVTGIGSFGTEADLENWRIVDKFDQIMKIGSYACSTKKYNLLTGNAQNDFTINRWVEMGYYGRNNQLAGDSGQREIFEATTLDIDKDIYIPGNKNVDILKTYEEESNSNLGVKLSVSGMVTKLTMKDVIAYAEQETFTNKDEKVWFLIQGTKKFPYITHIDVISQYIEELTLLSEDDADRKIWIEDGDDGYDLYYAIVATTLTANIIESSTTISLSSYVGIPDTSGNFIYLFVNGEKIKCTKSGSVITISERTDIRKHFIGEDVSYMGELLYPKTLMGYISSSDPLDFMEDGTFKVDAVDGAIDLTGAREKMIVIGSGVEDEIEMINVSESNVTLTSNEYTIILAANDREQRGTVAKEFPAGTAVYLMDYMSTLEVLRARDSKVEYSGKYNSVIKLNSAGMNEIDSSNANRVYIVRAKWKI